MKYPFLIILALSLSQISLRAQSADSSLAVSLSPQLRELFQLYQESKRQNPSLKGFRVQIFNGRKKDCLAHRARFLRAYPEGKAYLIYESPEFRTQVGDFRTRLEAEAFLREIIAEFPGSFAVETKINPPALKKAQKRESQEP